MNCRHCKTTLEHEFLDLGFAPPSNAYITKDQLTSPETFYPLKLMVCEKCWLVQTEDYAAADVLFGSDYAYFSSVSTSWLAHAERYCSMITQRLSLDKHSHVIEVASNDGYLLRNFLATGIPCTGIEPTDSTADAAEKIGIRVIREFFGVDLAERLKTLGQQADLILGNNVYAHVPDINDFTKGLAIALKPGGTITLEFPHLMRLLEKTQFDTVYHEHFSYLSLFSVKKVFEESNLRVLDVEELPTHGGSIRVYGCHDIDSRLTTTKVDSILEKEKIQGMRGLDAYRNFQGRANTLKNNLVRFLIDQCSSGRQVVAYGAAAKGCTLLNYAGIKPDLLPVVFDNAKSKQNKFLPGSHIPIKDPSMLGELRPDYVLILPWNIADEVIAQLDYIRSWGGKFVIAVPELQII